VGMAMWFADRIFRAEIMLSPEAWYSGQMYLLLASVVALAIYAFITSLGNQPILSKGMLDFEKI
jgi:hypothetical protein